MSPKLIPCLEDLRSNKCMLDIYNVEEKTQLHLPGFQVLEAETLSFAPPGS